MTLLAELFDRLDAIPTALLQAPAAEVHRRPADAPPAPAPTPTPAPAAEAASEPQRIVRTAATASPAWLAARDQCLSHVMICRACHAPIGRYCPTGAELRATYDTTPMELTP